MGLFPLFLACTWKLNFKALRLCTESDRSDRSRSPSELSHRRSYRPRRWLREIQRGDESERSNARDRHAKARVSAMRRRYRARSGEKLKGTRKSNVYSFLVYSFLLLNRKQSGGQVVATDGKSRYTACNNEADICW